MTAPDVSPAPAEAARHAPESRGADRRAVHPGSRNWHVRAALDAAARTRGAAFTVADCRAAYAAYYATSRDAGRRACHYACPERCDGTRDPADAASRVAHAPALTPRDVITAVHALIRAGVLGSAGRYGHLQVWPSASPLPYAPQADLGALVTTAVERAYARAQRPVSTREVQATLAGVLRDAGRSPSDYPGLIRWGIHTLLRTLAGGHPAAGQGRNSGAGRGADRLTPRIVCVATTTVTGRRWLLWMPRPTVDAAAPDPAEPTPAGQVDTVQPVGMPPGDLAGSGTPSTRTLSGDPGPDRSAVPGAESAATPAAATGPRDSVDALRRAVVVTAAALGRPPALQEVRWWAEAHADRDATARAVAESPLEGTAYSARRRDAQYGGRPGRLQRAYTPHTCYGGAPVRYAVSLEPTGAPETAARDTVGLLAGDRAGLRRCRLLDAVAGLRASDEWAELAELTRPGAADLLPSLVTACILQRRALLAAGVAAAAAPDADDDWVAVLRSDVGAERDALAHLTGWVEASPLNAGRRAYRLRLIARRSADLGAGEAAVLAAVPEAMPDGALRTRPSAAEWATGWAGLCWAARDAILPLAEAGAAALGLGGANGASSLLAMARRYPDGRGSAEEASRSAGSHDVQSPTATHTRDRAEAGPAPVWRRSYGAVALYERVDAVTAVFDAVGPPRASALMTGARRLLGHTLRDAAYLEASRAAAGPSEERVLVLGLGLLGDVERVTRAVRAWDPADPAAATAAALALVCADPPAAARHVAELDTRARGGAQLVTDRALARVEQGLLLSAVD